MAWLAVARLGLVSLRPGAAALFPGALCAMAVLGAEPGHDHHPPQLGSLKFETTCLAAAQPLFERGLGWLHSFGYAEAERNFAEAAAADPGCAIAYWGVAMSNYHPLWAPPTAAELAKGSIAVAKARAGGARSQREQDYVAAVAAFYGNAATLDHKARVRWLPAGDGATDCSSPSALRFG